MRFFLTPCTLSPSSFAARFGGVAGATACTFCHKSGLPTSLLNCTSCHARPPNGTVYPNIADAHSRHSTISVADNCGEYHFGLGSVHSSAAGTAPFSGCVAGICHTNSSAIGIYPVPNGTPPDCRACHTKAGPGNSCGSCHGVASALTAGQTAPPSLISPAVTSTRIRVLPVPSATEQTAREIPRTAPATGPPMATPM